MKSGAVTIPAGALSAIIVVSVDPNIGPQKEQLSGKGLSVKVLPNPSTQYFTIKLQSRINERAQLEVFDAAGRPVYLTEGSANQTYRFGGGFTSGSYFLRVTQGEKVQVFKLIN